ncbi:type II toxin-antitoxin system death-on-curing family toxin [Nissabacter sp. SGAir0207]|uniref:type II toxin-antitoxin system death-on-curing family toxin n=1 Tax=Nissabacter sp. SGAir0207 TaxID=2126321 RepID=UPI0010CD0BDB|nr:type II toxin-antitoxin system death-on-curing family toxin [Nissabacter sp. SGAir0207]QCR38355.1 type II toxin-antitoxin system death-on-curing family toxin [Nissabacter sp. SGAir0207]
MNTPLFITSNEVITIHDYILNRTPGVQGLADRGRVDAVVSRVINLYDYMGEKDIFMLAASYLFSISRGHVFTDANKRTALAITLIFLKRNGIDTRLTDNDKLVELTVSTAAGSLSLEQVRVQLQQIIERS